MALLPEPWKVRIVGLTPCAPLVLVILYIEFSKHTLLQFQSPVSSRVAFAEQLAYRTAPDLNYTWNPESEVVCRADSPNSHQTQITQRLLFRLQNPVRSSVFSAPMRTAPYCTASLRRKMKMKMKLAKKVKEKPSPQFFFSLQRIEESLSLSQKK